MSTISIVTICFNNKEDLLKTCASIDNQALLPFEHIVIDGSTKMDIKDWLIANQQPNYRSFVCEPDKGIADAFNKGILKTTGEIILLLNAGDTLYDTSVLQKATAAFDANPTIGWLHGKLNMLRGGIWLTIGKPFVKSMLYKGMRGTFHPTMYIKRTVYDRCGLYDTTIKMAMDYDFLCRIADEKSFFLDYPLATFDPTGISTNKYLDANKEMFACYQKHFGFSFKQQIWKLRLTLLHYTLQSPIGKWLYALKVKAGLKDF